MFDPATERKRQLECARLAADLVQMANETLNPDLKAHCLRMVQVWTDQVQQDHSDDGSATPILDD